MNAMTPREAKEALREIGTRPTTSSADAYRLGAISAFIDDQETHIAALENTRTRQAARIAELEGRCGTPVEKPRKGEHSVHCQKKFPDCLCNTCANDGPAPKSCCEGSVSHKQRLCGDNRFCPDYEPESGVGR